MTKDNSNELIYVDIKDIVPNAHQPRCTFSEKGIIELADSIRAHGVLEPLLIIKTGQCYKVIAGERRYRAARLAGLNKVPAILLNASQRELMEIAIVENLQRQNLNPIEEAQAIQALIETQNLTQDQVAHTLGRSRASICNLLRILSLPLNIQLLIQQGKLSQGHARSLLTIKDPKKMVSMAQMCIEKKWSVYALTQEIELINNPPAKKKKTQTNQQRQSIEVRSFIEDMERVFELPIKIKGDEHRGTLTLHYGSLSDLERIFELIQRIKEKKDY